MEIRGHSGKGISRFGLPWPILHREVKLGELGSPSLLKGTQGGSSEMDQGVVVCCGLGRGHSTCCGLG